MKKRAILIFCLSAVIMTVSCMCAFAQDTIVLEETFTDISEVCESIGIIEAEELYLIPATDVSVEEPLEEILLPFTEEPEEVFLQEPPMVVIEEILFTEEEQQEILIGDLAKASDLLRNGMTGDTVRDLQIQLIRGGYLSGIADGIFGPVTEAALRRYQFYQGQDVTGAARESDVISMASSGTAFTDLIQGSEGEAVVSLQKALQKLGFDPGEADGQFGPVTYQAVLAFQKAYDLYADGIVGNKTISVLVQLPEITVPVESESFSIEDFSSDLEQGSTGDEVLLLQQVLAEKGYLNADIDGDFGRMTAIAVKNYQLYNGLDVTGIADRATLEHLASNKTSDFTELTLGSKGAAVVSLQKALKKLGFDPGVIDGEFGKLTSQAVAEFQATYHLISDGIAGMQTISAMAGSPAVQTQKPKEQEEDTPVVVVDTYAIKAGSVGEDVLLMQKALAAYGYLDVEYDGYFGPVTEQALKKFEVYNDLPVNSTATSEVLKLLFSYDAVPYSPLKMGSSGTAVMGIQRVLYNLGYLDVLPDGIYGRVTSYAVGLFQYVNDLEDINGSVDNDTIDELTDLQDGYEEEMTSITPEQRELIQTAYVTPTTAAGLCAAWVSQVLAAYGINTSEILATRDTEYSYAFENDLTEEEYAYDTDFNANDYWAYICDSDEPEDLKPGMIVATRNTYSYMGRQFGHVGFYLGNNKVISSIGYLETLDLNVFDEKYNNTEYGSTIKWGFAPTLMK